MVPFARFLHRHEGGHGMSVRILRYRYRCWDEPKLHPVQDARWALTQLYNQHPDASIVLLGHSMGGRAALRVADHPAVTAVCALAPWIPGLPDQSDHSSAYALTGDRSERRGPRDAGGLGRCLARASRGSGRRALRARRNRRKRRRLKAVDRPDGPQRHRVRQR
jgi:pimeloyl-ACP methyl ester carboxylesterase